MKKIILDGYNVIHETPELALRLKDSLEAARKALAFHVSDWRRKYSSADVCIVFDGKDTEGINHSSIRLCGIECIFTKTDEKADERIISMVRKSEDPRSIVVISGDNNVRNNCRAHKARVEYSTFLMAKNKKTSPRRSTAGRDKYTKSSNLSKVTDHYEEYLQRKGVL